MVMIIPFFISVYIIQAIAPDWFLINQLIKQTPDPTTLIAITLFFPGLGTLLLLLNRKIKLVLLWKIRWGLFLVNATVSLVLAYAIWRFTPFLYNAGLLSLLVISLFTIIYLPQIVLFFDSVDLLDFKIFFAANYKNLSRYMTKILILGFFAVFLVVAFNTFVVFNNQRIVTYKNRQAYLAILPSIKKREPYYIYRSTNIVLYGNNFGLEGGKISDNVFTDSVHNQYQKIRFTFWDNNKIIFQVPLHWKTGIINVWLEKKVTWNSKRIIIKSNLITFKLLDSTGGWDKEDDAYFEQLKHLNKETLQINGYNSK